MLTKRLQACAAWVTTGGIACDVGTDHAYLAADLLKRHVCRHVIASDIGEGPLQAARRTLEQQHLLEQATLQLSDGLQQVDGTGVTDVIIAGMGGETMIHILEPCAWVKQGVNLILQPMTKISLLRTWLAENGYAILQEKIVKESHFFYTVMQVRYDGQKRQLLPWETEIGRQDWEDDVVQQYLQRKQAQFQKMAAQMQQSQPEQAAYYQQMAVELQEKLRETGKDAVV